MKIDEIKSFLDEQVDQFNHQDFIENDPISIPHLFERKEDIEIIGFIIATFSWGNRKSIINNGHKLVELMGNQDILQKQIQHYFLILFISRKYQICLI